MPMRQLRSCDFCGDEAAGVYEVLPPELSPTEAEQRRIVLCSDCRGTLEHTLKPLLDRLGIDGSAEGQRADAESARSESVPTSQTEAAAPEPPADEESSDDLGADLAGDRRSYPSDGSDSDGRVDDTNRGVDSTDTADGRIDSTDTDGRADSGSDDSAQDSGETATAGGVDELKDGTGSIATPTEAGRESAATSEPDDDTLHGTEAAGTDGGEDSPEPASEASDGRVADAPPTTGAAPDPDEEPEDFRTVMRLLGNRQFPVDRTEIVELAESAYELDVAHVERILDHAVDRDLIVDDGETLRKP